MTWHQELHETLIKLGLKNTEANVYLVVLEQGQSTVLQISKTTGIKRGTVYEITNRLIDQGFLKVTMSEKRRYLLAEDPRLLTAKFREYADTLTSQLPQLLALQNANENKPKITFYEGEDEVWQIFDDTLRQNQPILSITSVIDINNLLDPKKIENYIQRRVGKKIVNKVIGIDSEVSRLWKEKEKEELREVRLIPRDKYNFSADIDIYGNKVAIMSFKEDLFGIIIESEQISQLMKMSFELMWQASSAFKQR